MAKQEIPERVPVWSSKYTIIKLVTNFPKICTQCIFDNLEHFQNLIFTLGVFKEFWLIMINAVNTFNK